MTAPRFKVGDRVRRTTAAGSYAVGDEATFLRYDRVFGNEEMVVKPDNRPSTPESWWKISEVELVPEPTLADQVADLEAKLAEADQARAASGSDLAQALRSIKDLKADLAQASRKISDLKRGVGTPAFTRDQIEAVTHEVRRQLTLARNGDPGGLNRFVVAVPYDGASLAARAPWEMSSSFRQLVVSW